MAQESSNSASAAGVIAGGSIIGAFAAIGGIVLAILGLTHTLPGFMAAVGTVVLGAALVLEGGALGLVASGTNTARSPAPRLVRAASADALAGTAGIALGILALIGTAAMVLMPAAVIVFGTALVITALGRPIGRRRDRAQAAPEPALAATHTELDVVHGVLDVTTAYVLPAAEPAAESRPRVLYQAIEVGTGAQLLAGAGAVVLGILALIGFSPLVLTLIALLGVGGGVVINGPAADAWPRPARAR